MPVDKGPPLEWTLFGDESRLSRNKVIPELRPFIKFESRVASFGDVTFKPRALDLTIRSSCVRRWVAQGQVV